MKSIASAIDEKFGNSTPSKSVVEAIEKIDLETPPEVAQAVTAGIAAAIEADGAIDVAIDAKITEAVGEGGAVDAAIDAKFTEHQAAAVADSAATDVPGVNAVLNAVLASLRAAGLMATPE